MLMWKCDVCQKTGESPTSLQQFTVMPSGWRWRDGLVPAGKDKNGVRIHTCSKECAQRYDQAEVERVGLSWVLAPVSGQAGLSFKGGKTERPLKVK
jgi:hypothetical protein